MTQQIPRRRCLGCTNGIIDYACGDLVQQESKLLSAVCFGYAGSFVLPSCQMRIDGKGVIHAARVRQKPE